MLDVITAMIESCHKTIPMSGGGAGGQGRASRGGIPGWKEEVEPYKQSSRQSHGEWRAAGRPSTGPLHTVMVRQRTQYHHAVRRIKWREQEMRARGLFIASLAGDTSLLREMKKVRGGGGGEEELPESVAGAEGEEE